MAISSATLLELAALNLSSEQMSGVLRILSRSEEALEMLKAAGAARTARYRARGGGNIPDDLRQEVYERDGSVCVYCGTSVDLTCDHVVPVSRGGPTTLENLVAACRPCNSKKRDKERKFLARHPDLSADSPRTISDNGRTLDGNGTTSRRVSNISTSQDLNPPLSPPKPEPTGFSEFWELYPPRDGDRDRKGAVKAFRAALKRAPLETILSGLKRYVLQLEKKNHVGTQFVRQARTWLNADGWGENYEEAKPNGSLPTNKNSAQITETKEEYRARLIRQNQSWGH